MSQTRANNSRQGGLFGRVLWRGAWILQCLLWGFLLLFILHYWIIEVPAVRGYQEAGLADGFDGLAGIVASLEPTLGDLGGIAGHSGGSRFTRLQGDVIFNVWREHDEMPSWNAGLAKLSYDPSGRLLWARRYPAPDKKHDLVEDKSKQFSFPVVYSWSERARQDNGLAGPDSGPDAQPAAPAQTGAALPLSSGQTAAAGGSNGGRP